MRDRTDHEKVMERSIGDLRSVGFGPMPDPLRKEIEGLRDRARISAGRSALLGFAFVIVPIALAAVANPRSSTKTEFLEDFVLLPLMVVGWVAAAFAFRHSHRCCLWGRQLRADLALEELETFEWIDPEAEHATPVVAVINPVTHRLLSFNGEPLKSAMKVHVSEVAARPAYASRRGFPALLVPERGRFRHGRVLSEEEKLELENLCARQRMPNPIPALYLSSFSVALLLIAAFGGGGDAAFAGTGILSLLLSAFLWRPYLRISHRLRRLRADARCGLTQQLAPDQLPPTNSGPLTKRVEVLPRSGVIWTVNDEPAEWRRAA